jgi:hypothetical protein
MTESLPPRPWKLWSQADAILRGALPELSQRDVPWWRSPLLCVAFFGGLYGAVMGAYSLSAGALGEFGIGRAGWPIVFGALKVPILLGLSAALSLPPFFVLYTLCGLRDDFALVARALLATQVALSAILASLAPFTLLLYASLAPTNANYAAAVLWNLAMFALASTGAQLVLKFHLRPLLAREPRHRSLLRGWVIIYGFIGVQLAYILRPFIGDPNNAVGFLRADAFSNAYIALWGLVQRALGV